jgi:hypothetical protein
MLLRGELLKNIPGTDYFHIHQADLSTLKTNKIVTHNSDYPVSYALKRLDNAEIFESNENLLWFSQNVDVDHPRIFSIPIGFENSEWFPGLKKTDVLMRSRLNKNNLDKTILCSAMFNPQTYPDRYKWLTYFQEQSFCFTKNCINGQAFEEYAQKLSASWFSVCPRGNGIDTHRIWECLLCGTIPVVERCVNIEKLIEQMSLVHSGVKLPIMLVAHLDFLELENLLIAIEQHRKLIEEFIFAPTPQELTAKYWIDFIVNK